MLSRAVCEAYGQIVTSRSSVICNPKINSIRKIPYGYILLTNNKKPKEATILTQLPPALQGLKHQLGELGPQRAELLRLQGLEVCH